MQVVRVEPTPNPNAVKFVLDRPLPEGREFTSASEADGDELARQLFAIEGVSTIFYNGNYVTVSMAADADWHVVHESVTQVLTAHEPEAPAGGATAEQAGQLLEGTADDDELMVKINDLLQARVIPYLAADGGGMQIMGLDNKVLAIRYQGACGSCPSSIAGTLHAIEELLRQEVDPELKIVPA